MARLSVIGIRGFPGVQGGVEVHCENLYTRFSENLEIKVYRRKPYLSFGSYKSYPRIVFKDMFSTRIKGVEAVLHTFISCCHVIVHRPDVVHVHNIGPGLFIPFLKLFGLRVCMTYHSPNYEHKKWGFFARLLLKTGEWFSLNFADDVIFVNSFQLDKIGVRYRCKCHYVPNGIAIQPRANTDDFIRKYGLEKRSYVLAVGRITPEKGFDVLVRAVSLVPEIKHLVIAGASDHDKGYFEYLKSLDVNNKVVFTGFTTGDDLRELYSFARVFVLSSYNEGFPLVLLEAMSYKLPMVVTDIPATHLLDIPSDDYVKAGDIESFSSAIAKKYASGEMEVGYDLSKFNWDEIALITEKILLGQK